VSTSPTQAVSALVRAGGPRVVAQLGRIEALLAQEAVGHGPELAEHASATINAGGKRLRPLLVLLCGAAADGVPAGDDAPLVRAGAAVELVHSATLVHDDVLDLAPLRRGVPTVFARAGREAATQTGDLLFARAFALLAANGDPRQVRALSDASSALARGELLQRSDAFEAAISIERYLERCDLKTARLFQASCELGALNVEGLAVRDVVALRGFGREIGLAFQILDDVLDVSGPVERTGKHRGTDLLDGTVTLPLILARAADARLAAVEPREIRDAAQAEAICDAIAATGALEQSRERALHHVEEARRLIPATLPGSVRAALALVADGVVGRYS
jgi:geranylgeranyl pyrophosphate synthase